MTDAERIEAKRATNREACKRYRARLAVDRPEAHAARQERNREMLRKRRATQPEKVKRDMANWVAAHPGRLAELQRQYVVRNIDAVRLRWREKAERTKRERPDLVKTWQARANKRHRQLHAEVLRERENARRAATQSIENFAELWAGRLADYGHACAYCARTDVALHMDHVEPISKGGLHEIDNLVPACKPCNSSKGTRSLIVFLAHRAAKLAA